MRGILLAAMIGALLAASAALAQGAAPGHATPVPPAKAAQPKPADSATKPEVPSPEFARYLESLWPKAQARGVSRATFDLAFQGVTPDPKVAVVGRAQSEFAQPISAYLDSAVSGGRIRRGGELARQWAATLDAVEAFYGVPRSVVLAAWGMESNFGGYTGKNSVIRALATLAFHRQRAGYFERELIAALEMIERDHIRPAGMLGSWAGAMGQTQFMPSSFLAYAADGDGDGKRDIWTSAPDALASIANFLKEHGWKPGLPWGFEVALPEGFDYAVHRRGFAEWTAAGVKRVDGAEMPRAGEGLLFLPAGARGPAFLLSENFFVIKAYNTSDSYALAVGHLGDRILGGAPVRGAWPKAETMLGRNERVEVQKRLSERGLLDGDPDGRIGFKTRDAVRRFQLDRGLLADGHADPAVLKELRASR
jgi:membrane-bound lytic murein transglycosylase B